MRKLLLRIIYKYLNRYIIPKMKLEIQEISEKEIKKNKDKALYEILEKLDDLKKRLYTDILEITLSQFDYEVRRRIYNDGTNMIKNYINDPETIISIIEKINNLQIKSK